MAIGLRGANDPPQPLGAIRVSGAQRTRRDTAAPRVMCDARVPADERAARSQRPPLWSFSARSQKPLSQLRLHLYSGAARLQEQSPLVAAL
ncbi:hypothetical protein EYF80_054742 [Liparis tanakae]|uniref:Uncharacterized protein n=1 Tax=Liparis tanakae TaxID=230148 RepID=A0A4Z2F3M4_9TELE|nr:hypothetical protein EYF80_054742 [Liparis tanakae]